MRSGVCVPNHVCKGDRLVNQARSSTVVTEIDREGEGLLFGVRSVRHSSQCSLNIEARRSTVKQSDPICDIARVVGEGELCACRREKTGEGNRQTIVIGGSMQAKRGGVAPSRVCDCGQTRHKRIRA